MKNESISNWTLQMQLITIKMHIISLRYQHTMIPKRSFIVNQINSLFFSHCLNVLVDGDVVIACHFNVNSWTIQFNLNWINLVLPLFAVLTQFFSLSVKLSVNISSLNEIKSSQTNLPNAKKCKHYVEEKNNYQLICCA